MTEKRKKLLIIDDDALVRRSIAVYLTDSGFEVYEAGEANKLCEAIQQYSPDLVITGASDVSVVENKLSPAGILFVVSSRSRSQDSFDKDLRLLSKILEKEDRAEEFFSWRQYYLDQLKEKINKIEPKDKIKVYCESNIQARSAATNASGAHWAIIAAGGENMRS